MPRLLAFLWWWAILLALLLHLSPAPVGAAVPRQHVRHEDEKAEEEEAGEGGGGGDVKGDDDDGVFGGDGQKSRLYGNPACREELDAALTLRRCLPLEQYRRNDLATVFCLTNVPPPPPPGGAGLDLGPADGFRGRAQPALSDRCEDLVWKVKVEVTNDENMVRQVKKVCSPNLDVFSDCLMSATPSGFAERYHITGNGRVLSCLIEKSREEMALGGQGHGRGLVEACNSLLRQLESVVFSDYRLLGDFIEHCQDDINSLTCGRIQDPEDPGHSQGRVIECLMKSTGNLTEMCREEIYRVAEYQGDDYHLDRSLFLACRRDRQNLCAKVKSGEGRVYKCLMSNKMNQEMSEECRDQLTRRQALMSSDYKVSRNLRTSCKREIEENRCKKGLANKDGHRTVKLAEILLCLEDVLRNDEGVIGGKCLFEMREHRRMLMEDYKISPEIVADCGPDIKKHCLKVESGGRTLHCLMGVAARLSSSSSNVLTSRCEASLRSLMREVDVASDWRVDPILQQNCQQVAAASGCDEKTDGAAVMTCLLDLAATNSNHMTRECKVTLMEINYFMSRDFVLNPKLYKKCRLDAKKFCNAESDWHEGKGKDHRLVFPCLVRYLYVDETEDPYGEIGELSDDCADQVEKTLEQRAISVNLHPEVEEACRGFLIMNCADKTGDGQEVVCLQDNFDSLDVECQEAVTNYTKIESRNVHLNTAVMLACRKTIDQQCKDEEELKQMEGAVLHCLLEYKTSDPHSLRNSESKCFVVLEHWQILALKDWHFSPAFKKSCSRDVRELCSQPIPRTKADVMNCLSNIVLEDLSDETKPRVSGPCRKELKFQLLQKHQEVKLNPKLADACHDELAHCDGRPSLECLRGMKHSQMSSGCRIVLFRQEKEETWQNRVDASLMSACRNEAERHCPGNRVGPGELLNCLKENMEDANFDVRCRKMVTRRVVQQMSDYRLNPRLQKACKKDLPKFCSEHILHQDSERSFLEGKVIECLKDQFLQDHNKLTDTCKKEVENLMVKSALDIAANPILVDSCPESVAHCRKEVGVNASDVGDHGKVEECLKRLFRDRALGRFGDRPHCIVEVAKLVETESMDIEVDRALHDACSVDLAKFCRSVPSGGGRRISCLRDVTEDKNLKLEPACENLLRERLQLYLLALKENPIRSVEELYLSLSSSPYRLNFLAIFLACVLVVFLVGTVCGRATKRAHYAKNK